MDEETQSVKEKEKFKSIEEVFEKRLGIPFPEKPEDLPLEILLKPNVFGGLIEAVLAQETEDQLYEGSVARERSQFIGNLSRDGSLKDTSILIGSEKFDGGTLEELKKWLRPLIGLISKPLVFWHTHTSKYSPLPTEADIAIRVGEDRKCVIYLHASPSRITAIIQTKKAYPRFLPLSTISKGIAAYDEIVTVYDSDKDHEEPELKKLATLLEKYGYALYVWKKPNQIKTVKDGVNSGCFLSGIKMNKV